MAIQTKGYITIELGVQGDMRPFRLDGTVGNQIQVGWREKDGGDELALGSLPEIMGSVLAAFGVDKDFDTVLNNRIKELESIPPLKPIAELLTKNAVYITDLAITAVYNDEESKYKVTDAALGFRVAFEGMRLGPISLREFGVLFEYTPSENGGDSVLTQRIPA